MHASLGEYQRSLINGWVSLHPACACTVIRYSWLTKKASSSTKVVFEDPQAFSEAVKAVRSDFDSTNWCLVGYENETVLRMVGEGTGGLEALLDAAELYGVNYGLLRVSKHIMP